jgi:hypothetical protein
VKRKTRRAVLLLGAFVSAWTGIGPLCAAELFSEPIRAWDTLSDTWVATDGLGRSLPGYADVGPRRSGRFVGIFYFLWLGAHVQGGPYDVSKLKAENPGHPSWGPMYAPHHWGESVFGYYLTEDPLVLRKHAHMLADAGVDTLIFDVTNQVTYRSNYMALLRVFEEIRRDGERTPQVVFLCPFWQPAKVVTELWADLYLPNLYPDLWFRWEGKPLILADPALVPELNATNRPASAPPRDFFTFRKPQPDYFQGPTQPNMWSWLEVYPQHVFTNSAGRKEQMAVGVAQNAVKGRLGSMSEPGVCGRSFHQGKSVQTAADVQYGYNFAEQFDYALKQDPEFIFITGWNEWIAGRHPKFNGISGDMFPDEFDEEGSRDIEPMKGGHRDNYYYQMAAYIRRFKGVSRPPSPSAPQTIRLDGDFSQWQKVAPEYRDHSGDTFHRDFDGFNHCARYTNSSGRNDFVTLKVARDKDNLYFYARTKNVISPLTDPHWMMLMIDADQDHGTGWEGYDFIVNRQKHSATSGVLERNAGGWNWTPVCDVRFAVKGNELQLAIPRAALGKEAGKGPLRFDFKWADNVPESGDILDFIADGDVAPDGRTIVSRSPTEHHRTSRKRNCSRICFERRPRRTSSAVT